MSQGLGQPEHSGLADAGRPGDEQGAASASLGALEVLTHPVTDVPAAEARRPVGADGGVLSVVHGGGVTGTVVEACETLPAASLALTYRPHRTPGSTVRAVLSTVPGTEVMSWPSW